jgi:hypothetical protein
MRNWMDFTMSFGPAPRLEYKVAALIAAIALAGVVTKTCLEPADAATQPASEAKMEERLSAIGPDDGLRSRPVSTLEFAAVYGLGPDKAYTTLAAAEWSTPAPTAAAGEQAPAAKPQRKATQVAQAAIAVPPRRPTDLIVTAQAPGREENKGGVRLLGVSLPGFVPSGERIAKTVVSWGGSIAGVIPGL